MYLRNLTVTNLKLLRNFELGFTNDDGSPRMWTILLGENGTCKTSILRAIALGASGDSAAELAELPAQYQDKRTQDRMRIVAEFVLDAKMSPLRRYPGLPENTRPDIDVVVTSTVEVNPEGGGLRAASRYSSLGLRPDPADIDPIYEARSDDRSFWFVAGYGVQRMLRRDADELPSLGRPSIDRLRPLFGREELVGTSFAALFAIDPQNPKARLYEDALQAVLFSAAKLLPGFLGIGGEHGFLQQLPIGSVELPERWLSHGYQSTIAWVADLVGYLLLEADVDHPLPPAEMEGLVLVDEIDLYLHPTWQRQIIHALRSVFPRIQFVATTHSALCLVGLRTDQDEIVVLRQDDQSGDVVRADLRGGRAHEPDPRLMTGTEIYRTYFGIEQIYPSAIGEQLRAFRYVAADPTRSDDDDARLGALESELLASGIVVGFPRTPRTRR